MFERRIPEWLRHAPTPTVRGFATIAGCEAAARGILISVFPVAVFRVLGDAASVSKVYFVIGLASLVTGLLVPWITRFVPRRWVYSFGALLYTAGSLAAATGAREAVIAGLAMTTISTVVTFVCINAYVLDHIAKAELGRSETLRLFYSAASWTAGPAIGVWLFQIQPELPFLIATVASLVMLGVFTWMRLGNGRTIQRARAPAPNPLRYLGRFFGQPRLIAGWLFAVIRSCGWWAYIVYLPIFAVQNGLPESTGGTMLSLTNATLFLTPVMLRWMRSTSIRRAVRTGFAGATTCFLAAALLNGTPVAAAGVLFCASVFLILLDVSGGLPFLMAVKPSERTEMSAVYASYRDVSGIMTPGLAWIVLLVLPVWGVFAATGLCLAAAYTIAGTVNPRLGAGRMVETA